ncbi:hypothetical protein [Gordonia rhizosphera]|uniref:Uncharacterized protein n=1 Tax=Gordonia rhizosphera NBRC 16068 TaxID=1108045 RepID=K6V010_9ACTN|nr:hypothetical protein [Gordonia rhizosphera]GAB89143.1 hypothetical protein GORHZ_052_00110 [Gordonia rhizosphera NBRC 16068]
MTSIDTVGELCERGLAAEMAGRFDDAAQCYQRACDSAVSVFDRCLAAHYRARSAADSAERVQWTRLSVELAAELAEVGDERVYALLPTLQIAYAGALLVSGAAEAARQVYLLAADAVENLHLDPNRAMVLHCTIYEGLSATGFVPQGASSEFFELVSSLKSADSWGPLAVILGAYIQNSGTDEAAARFVLTLRELYAAGLLNGRDQEVLGRAITSARAQLEGEGQADGQGTGPDSVTEGDDSGIDPFGTGSPNVAFRI